jgi:outer membrane protein OmpA-like peptidoglycan-associated protein
MITAGEGAAMVRRIRVTALGAAGLLLAGATALHAQTAEQMERIRNWNPKIGEFQKPGEIQKAGDIQVPRGIQAVKVVEAQACERRLSMVADALFAFDQWTLTPEAEETLVVVVPEIEKAGKHPVSIEGHTDAKGSDQYNETLSAKRAGTVKDWLVARKAVPEATKVVAYGERKPVAPNQKPDGSDDPEGRQKNRRVEVVIDTCG